MCVKNFILASNKEKMAVLSLFFVLLLSFHLHGSVDASPEAWPASLARGHLGGQQQQQQQQGGLLPFPEGRGPDGTLYKTDYRCEGDNMTMSCVDSDGPGLDGTIHVVRGNFGRFSIAICNRHGQTDWSVNCMAPQTTRILQQRCDGKRECLVAVNTASFHDACPGTHKYLEIHYACLSNSKSKPNSGGVRKAPALPPWMFELQEANPIVSKNNVNSAILDSSVSSSDPSLVNQKGDKAIVRKPILVTEKVDLERRVPITTPRPTTKRPTTTTTTTMKIPTTFSSSSATKAEKKRKNKKGKINEGSGFSSGKATTLASARHDQDQHLSLNTPTSGYDGISHQLTHDVSNACQPTTARQLQWDWTQAGQVALQPCPIGASGLARWYCGSDRSWQGSSPDMSDCKSIAMSNLESQVRKEDPENVLVSSLAYLTRTKALYGGDLESAVAIMRTVASRIQYRLQLSTGFHDKLNHIRQVLLNVLRSAANMLEDGPSSRSAWRDLSLDRQMKVATGLMLALEENAFILAGVTNEPTEILETYETLTMAISVVDAIAGKYTDIPVEFPGKPLLYVDDSVRLSRADLASNAQAGLAEAVFFSYGTLHEILQGAKFHLTQNVEKYQLNSRVISASLGGGRHVELDQPVQIKLRHLEETGFADPICVFWDYEVHGWSDSGCKVVETNSTFSLCQCDHLTNFAVLMRPVEAGNGPHNQEDGILTSVRLDIVAYIVSSVILMALIILILRMRIRLRNWCKKYCCTKACCCCRDKTRRTSHLEKCQSLYSTGGHPSSIGGHYPQISTGTKARTTHPGSIFASTTSSRTPSQYVLTNQQLQNQTSSSCPLSQQPLMVMTKQRPHITLNPYSTQLVDNLNMMMPSGGQNQQQQHSSTSNSSSSTASTSLGQVQNTLMSPQLMSLTSTLRRGTNQHPSVISTEDTPTSTSNSEVVYRAVSPHGHVYWEIDPSQVYGTNNNKQLQCMSEENVALLAQQHQQVPQNNRSYAGYLSEEDRLLQQHLLSSSTDLGLHESNFQPGVVMMASSTQNRSNNGGGSTSFVRTGANRFVRKSTSQQAQQKQLNQQLLPVVSTVSTGVVQATATPSGGGSNVVPEQLQTQVQIRDIRPIQVSVKSSEYIEAKIRTLRRNNNFNKAADP